MGARRAERAPSTPHVDRCPRRFEPWSSGGLGVQGDSSSVEKTTCRRRTGHLRREERQDWRWWWPWVSEAVSSDLAGKAVTQSRETEINTYKKR